MMEKTTADADLKTALNVIRTVEGNNQAAIDAAIACNIRHGRHFTDPQTPYALEVGKGEESERSDTSVEAFEIYGYIAWRFGRKKRKVRRLVQVAAAPKAVG